MFSIYQSSLGIAFWATLVLILFHYLSPWIALRLPINARGFISFAAGVSVSYVFLHMLPNLVEYNKPIGEFLIKNLNLNRLTELSIYIFTLIGFSVYYGLDLLAEGEGINNNRIFILHLGMFCLYNFLITYTMSLRVQASILATILFTFAMALHFVFTDQKFCRLYPLRFRNLGRFILILALLFGWLCSVLFNPVNVLVSAFMLSFLAGSVLLNVFREELPSSNLTRYSWFIAGVMLIAMILLLNASLGGQAKSL